MERFPYAPLFFSLTNPLTIVLIFDRLMPAMAMPVRVVMAIQTRALSLAPEQALR